MRWKVVIAAVLTGGLLGMGCGGSAGAVNGKVLVDGAPVQGQEVLLQGASQLRTATTGADGSYQLSDVPEGTYLLSVDVSSTQERHAQVAVSVKAPVTVPDLTFQGTASLTGTVTNEAGAPVTGAQVQVLGTQVTGSTDKDGRFAFSTVPTGTRTIAVTSETGAAQAEQTLVWHDTKDVALRLTAVPPEPPPPNATVTGQAGFYILTDLTLIEVSIPAAGVSTHADSGGNYSLSVPPGDWDVFAKAPSYPSQKIGHVQVVSGQTASVPQAALSLYTELPTFGLQDAVWNMPSNSGGDRKAIVLQLVSSGGASYYAFDLARHSLRLISVEGAPVLSADGQWAAMADSNNQALVLNLETSETFRIPSPSAPQSLRFSNDSRRLLFNGNSNVLYGVKLADRSVTTLPDYQEVGLSGDRLLVRTTNAAPFVWQLVTAAGITTAFTNVPGPLTTVQSASPYGPEVVLGLEACATAPCPVDVLGPMATVAQPTSLTASDIVGGLTAGHWVITRVDNQFALIDLTSGAATVLPSTVLGGFLSPDGSRVAYLAQSGVRQLFEHALPLPDPATLTPVVTSTDTALPLCIYFSSSQCEGYNDAPVIGAPYRFTVNAGVLIQDLNYLGGSGKSPGGRTLAWLGTDGKARVSLGRGPIHTAPEGQTVVPSEAQVELLFGDDGTASTGDKLAVSWGDGKTWLFDQDAAPRSVPFNLQTGVGGVFVDGALRAPNQSGEVALVAFDSGQLIPLQEVGHLGVTSDRPRQTGQTFVLSHSMNAVGAPVGGAYALVPRF